VAGALLRGSVGLSGVMPEIRLPVFEGPLDLLLRLIERDDLDITAVSLVAVADQYLRAVRSADGTQVAALAEFVAIGARLIYLKSKALLPRQPQEADAALDHDDVGRELVDLLKEYRRYSEVADMLGERQESGLRSYSRAGATIVTDADTGLEDVTLDALRKLMLQAMARKPAEPQGVIERDPVMTLTQRVADLRSRLRRSRAFSFRALMAECETRVEVIIAFMAILELLKSGECDARQQGNWEDIEVVGTASRAAAG